jgi:hypothetical protein
MATLLLSAAGAAIGGSFGGTVAGLGSLALGKAAGATLGSVIDQRLLGLGSEPVETGRVERFRVMGSGEGTDLPRVFGRMRVAGQLIWSSRFLESVNKTQVGGKGAGGSQAVRAFSYSISLAVALCEGEITRVGRIWADGQVLAQSTVTWRLHPGSEDQLPDPLISAIEGVNAAPAYRGTAYVVFENLELGQFGNRIPQFNFEVFRRSRPTPQSAPRAAAEDVRGVALVPGTGEYALATTPVFYRRGRGRYAVPNVNNDQGRPDLVVSLEHLQAELPNAKAVSLVVSWFGNDLRCDRCVLQPAVEQREEDAPVMPWRVCGIDRASAKTVSRADDRPLFGGTPTDASILQAVAHLKDTGRSVMFYPFILMDIPAENTLEDPWSGSERQPTVPWRGRITLSRAPGRAGSPDKSAAAAAEVEAFFGLARISDFQVVDGAVVYSGPDEWSYRRFILHYAHLCAMAGGVESFCIGSEMRSLTQIRDAIDGYPAVRSLCALAADVRTILGPEVRIGYAADWSEYFGHHPADGSGDLFFHLDPLWANPAIDFVGIDNYMPLSDWRDGSEHADADFGSIYDLTYLCGNVAGGEGYDWYYVDAQSRAVQARSPITDGAYGEPWVFRYKDLLNWWSRPHFNRIGGIRANTSTDWQPRSKPFRFTELGCPAIDKGTNQPNVFLDPKSSESYIPFFSSGARDDFIQQRYIRAILDYWQDPANNPISMLYGGCMVDLQHAYVWAWDARPWPDFPTRLETWVDGANYDRGHWINARLAQPTLAEIVAEVCERSDVHELDLGRLYGSTKGYTIGAVESARQSLQPLMITFGFDSLSSTGRLAFASRSGRMVERLRPEDLVQPFGQPILSATRHASAAVPGKVALGFVRADMDYRTGTAEAVSPDAQEPDIAQTNVPVVLSEGEARAIVERWLAEQRVARDMIEFALSPSRLAIEAGDVVRIEGAGGRDLYRVDRVEEAGFRRISAVRVEPALYGAAMFSDPPARAASLEIPTPADVEFLDLPLLTGEEVPHAPHIAVSRTPWSGAVAVYTASADFGYTLNREVLAPAVIGETLEPLVACEPGIRSAASLRVRLTYGRLQSVGRVDLMNGANAAALRQGGVGDWEVFQFELAELVAPSEYVLRGLLRGQAGTDGVIPELWPASSIFVLLDRAPVQINLPRTARGLERHYRIGSARLGYDDPSFVHEVRAFAGVGLRPYRPSHPVVTGQPDGAITIRWTRRTRVDGDNWGGMEVPLGEEREIYRVVLRSDDTILRNSTTSVPVYVYTLAEQVSDGNPTNVFAEIAQISDAFGPGPALKVKLLPS